MQAALAAIARKEEKIVPSVAPFAKENKAVRDINISKNYKALSLA